MAGKELLPKVELLNLDDDSEEESPPRVCRQPDHRKMITEPKRPEYSCMHEKLSPCEFSCRKKLTDRRKGDSSKDFPTLDPSLETAQVTTIARKLEERKAARKSKKKARREKKKAEKMKQGAAKKEPGDSSNSKAHPLCRDGQCSHQHDESDEEISQEEIEALIKRLRIVPRELPNLREDRYLTVPEYDDIYEISYCGHQKACDDYRLQHANKNFVPFLERVASLHDFLDQYSPILQRDRRNTVEDNSDDSEDEVFTSIAPMDKIFIPGPGLGIPLSPESPSESDEEPEPEEDRYLRYQRSQIVEFLEKIQKNVSDLGKEQKMKEIEMLKQMGFSAEWVD